MYQMKTYRWCNFVDGEINNPRWNITYREKTGKERREEIFFHFHYYTLKSCVVAIFFTFNILAEIHKFSGQTVEHYNLIIDHSL